MIWQGKALGALIGVAAAGPVGAVFGTFIGHLFDARAEEGAEGDPVNGDAASVQEAYFRCVFQSMGHLAKADGRVTEDEIRAARAMMSELRLDERETRLAMDLYMQGKSRDFPLESRLRELRRLCGKRSELRRMFVQIQLQVALLGGSLNGPGRDVLARICAALGVSAYDAVRMEALLRLQQSSQRGDRVADAYELLGLSRNASDGEITKAYRRLMNQNHPDKLHARGLPEAMMKLAEEKTRQIRAAYDVLREARGMK
ncbi:MAG TPA: co-chaperone DjlA [Steroidobacter sp.]|nr:co-chaperone DjlA [Steroidobacter sp.]